MDLVCNFGPLAFGYGVGGIMVMGRARGCVDGPRLLRVRLGELVPHSLGWGCALGVGG